MGSRTLLRALLTPLASFLAASVIAYFTTTPTGVAVAIFMLAAIAVVWFWPLLAWPLPQRLLAAVALVAAAAVVSILIATHHGSQSLSTQPPLPMPTGIYTLGQQAGIHPSKASSHLYSIGINVFLNNHSENSYRIQNYFTESLQPVIDETSDRYFAMFAAMRGVTDERVKLGKFRGSGLVGPWDTTQYVSAYHLTKDGRPAWIGGKQLSDFIGSKTAFYYAGTIVATSGEVVKTLTYCGFVVYYPGQTGATIHTGPAAGC
jgi:hypothetical protein